MFAGVCALGLRCSCSGHGSRIGTLLGYNANGASFALKASCVTSNGTPALSRITSPIWSRTLSSWSCVTGEVNVSVILSALTLAVAGIVLFICISLPAVSEWLTPDSISVLTVASNLLFKVLLICVVAPLVNLLSPEVFRLYAPDTTCL